MTAVKRAIYIVVAAFVLFGLPASLPAQPPDEVDRLNPQIAALIDAGKYSEALPLARRVVEIREKNFGRDHPEVVPALETLAKIYRALGRTAEASALERRMQATLAQRLGGGAAPAQAPAPPPPPPAALRPFRRAARFKRRARCRNFPGRRRRHRRSTTCRATCCAIWPPMGTSPR